MFQSRERSAISWYVTICYNVWSRVSVARTLSYILVLTVSGTEKYCNRFSRANAQLYPGGYLG